MQYQDICIDRLPVRENDRNTTSRATLEVHGSLLALLREQPELPLSLVREAEDGQLAGISLNEPRRRWLPCHFNRTSTESKRTAYLKELMQRAAGARRLTLGQWFGFSDFFYPIGADELGPVFLHGSYFLLEPLDWTQLIERWAEHSGLPAASTEPHFVRFVTMALERPVLELDALRNLEQLFESLHASLFEPQRLLDQAPANWRRTLEEPSTALAVKVVAPTCPAADPLRTRVEVYRALHRARALFRQWPELERTSRESFGLVAVSYEELGAAQVAERAASLSDAIEQRFELRCVTGAALGAGKQEPIVDRAIAALGCALRETRSFVLADAVQAASARQSYAKLARATQRVIAAFERAQLGESTAFAEDYLDTLLAWSDAGTVAVRDQLLMVLWQLVKAVQKRHLLTDEGTDHLTDEICQRLERAGSTEQLVDEFKQALQRLALFNANSSAATYCMNLDRTLDYLKEHCTESLSASRVARRAGLSLPTFSRVFKQATGTSFARYVRVLRVARAEQLLATTRLSGERVADLCGFKSHQNLIRSFKRVTGYTPGEYRQRKVRDLRAKGVKRDDADVANGLDRNGRGAAQTLSDRPAEKLSAP